jgi:hypothetical protein
MKAAQRTWVMKPTSAWSGDDVDAPLATVEWGARGRSNHHERHRPIGASSRQTRTRVDESQSRHRTMVGDCPRIRAAQGSCLPVLAPC